MDTAQLDRALLATLEDGRLSRAEREALADLLQATPLDANRRAQLRARAFALAKDRLNPSDAHALAALAWVEDVVKLLAHTEPPAARVDSRACFSPGDGCLTTILAELGRTRKTADICVFTITDDRIAQAIVAAHQRGVQLRIITDNDKQYDGGSDVERLRRAGIALKVDETEHHMHHKFAILDGETLLNGSYNWTRSASAFNEENLVVTSDRKLISTFSHQFAKMWTALGH
jgi:phosphatidylserine/phosphatidylglycerophosphate/cardiolipin synthase-like enzyme